MNFLAINILFVLLIGLVTGLSELIARYSDSKYIFKTWQSYVYILLNGAISIVALFLLWHFQKTIPESISRIEIRSIVTAGLGGMILLRSYFFSVKYKDRNIDLGFGLVAQVFLDLIERKMKNRAASKRILEIAKIMKGVVFDDAKNELSTLCTQSIDNFSKNDSENLVAGIANISSMDLTNVNKAIQLGILISYYCDNETLINSIEVLELKKNTSTDENDLISSHEIDYYINLLKIK